MFFPDLEYAVVILEVLLGDMVRIKWGTEGEESSIQLRGILAVGPYENINIFCPTGMAMKRYRVSTYNSEIHIVFGECGKEIDEVRIEFVHSRSKGTKRRGISERS